MKPRLPPAPLTPEDRFILRRRSMFLVFHHLWQGADRRDADLMHSLSHRMLFCPTCDHFIGNVETGHISEFRLRWFRPEAGDGTLAGLLMEYLR